MAKANVSNTAASKTHRDESDLKKKTRQVSDDITLILPPLAHWSDRGLAAIIDALLFLTPTAIGILLAAGISPISTFAARTTVLFSAFTSLLILFLSWAQEGSTGQTTGKRILGLVCISDFTGEPIGVLNGLKKGVLRIVVDAIPLGWGWFKQASADGNRKANSDQMTHSSVVYSRMAEQQDIEDVSREDLEALAHPGGTRGVGNLNDTPDDSYLQYISPSGSTSFTPNNNEMPFGNGNAQPFTDQGLSAKNDTEDGEW